MSSALRDFLGTRPWWMNGLFAFCVYMAFVYVPWDLFVKPVERDAEVWFGIVFHGAWAKILAVPHWLVYAAGASGFWRMRAWMWPWAAVYAAEVTLSMVIWPLAVIGGMRGLFLAAAAGLAFGTLTRALWRSRGLFRPAAVRLADRYGEWALVTGASAGIGRELARALAREGLSLVLTARRSDRLAELATELERAHGIRTRVVPLDLGAAGGAERLARAVADLEIGMAALNAGFGGIGDFVSLEPERVREMVELNCTAPAVLARALLPAMQQRGRGAVIVVGSVAGAVPMPFHALYSATKAFDNTLGEALAEELRGTGVDVVALLPGSTETEFQQSAGERPHAGESAARVAEEALRALGREPSFVVGTFNWLRVNAAVRLLSRPLLLRLVRRASEARLPGA